MEPKFEQPHEFSQQKTGEAKEEMSSFLEEQEREIKADLYEKFLRESSSLFSSEPAFKDLQKEIAAKMLMSFLFDVPTYILGKDGARADFYVGKNSKKQINISWSIDGKDKNWNSSAGGSSINL